MRLDPATIVGLIGVALVVGAYCANQLGSFSAENWHFPASNLAGSLLILVSLYSNWNLPSVVIEATWSTISLFGLIRRLRPKLAKEREN